MAAPKEISMAAVRFLSPTPEVIAQFPNAAKCTVYVPISNLKRELVGSSPFKPTSKIDFDAAEKFRFVKTPARTGSRASFCYIHALGYDHGDLLSEINKKGRFRMPTPKVLGNVSGGEITDGPEGDLNTSRRSKSVKAKQVREANRSNYTLLSQQASSSWLKVNAPVKSSSKPSQRSSSLDSSHKRKSESDHGESPLKRSVSSDRLPVPCSASSDADLHSVLAGLKNQFDTAVENMKAAYQEQTAAYREQKEELRKERELRIKAEERMNTLWGAFQAHTRISAQQHHDGEIDVMGSVTNALRRRRQHNQVVLSGKSPFDLSAPLDLKELGVTSTGKTLFCDPLDYSQAMGCNKPYEWAKAILTGVYGKDAKLMRFNEPRDKEAGLKQIPEDEFRVMEAHFNNWLDHVLKLPKDSPTHTEYKKSLGRHLGAAGAQLFKSPRTGNGSKLSQHQRERKRQESLGRTDGSSSDERANAKSTSSVSGPVSNVQVFVPFSSSTQENPDPDYTVCVDNSQDLSRIQYQIPVGAVPFNPGAASTQKDIDTTNVVLQSQDVSDLDDEYYPSSQKHLLGECDYGEVTDFETDSE